MTRIHSSPRALYAWLAVAIAISPALAGCLGETQNESHDYDTSLTQTLEFDHPLSVPVVIRSTELVEGVWHRLVVEDDCMFPEPYPAQYVRVWDRYGLVYDEIHEVQEDEKEQWFWIPLPGSAPWMVAGEAYSCFDGHQSRLYNITDGTDIAAFGRNKEGLSLNTARSFENISFALNVGESRNEYSWQGSEFVWRSKGGGPALLEGRGQFSGSVVWNYPEGSIARYDRFSLGSHNASFMPHMFIPGEHKIVIKADMPVVNPVEGLYINSFMEFDSTVCQFGFNWTICAP